MTNRLSPANLVVRSAAFARSLAACVPPPPRLLPFRQREGGTMSAARFAPLILLAAALGVLAVAGALFVLHGHPAHAQDGSAPAKPTGLSATASHDQVTLTWDDPQDESITGYVILRRVRVNDQGGDFSELVADTGTAALTYTDDTVAASTTYTYRIKAINEHGTSERSRWYHINTPEAPPPDTPPEPDNSPATGAPTITGAAQAGETLAADTTGIADEDGLENAAFTYQWLGDGSAIQGATARAYTLTDSDEGKAIRVRVSFTDNAGNEESLTSAPTDAVAAAEPAEPPGKPRGLEATASHHQVVLTWNDPGDDSITGYVVLRRNRDTDAKGHFDELVSDTGTAALTYTDDSVAAETRYTYRIKAINEHGVSERSRWYHIDTPAAPEPPANNPATGSPAITGTARVGETLTVNMSGIADEDGLEDAAFSYQWLADGTAIPGATASAYTPAEADEGKAVTVQVNFTDNAGNDETLTSAPTAAVAAAEPTEPPAKPTDLSATASHNQVVLTWKDPNDNSITGYVILRRIPGVDPEGQFSELVSDTGTAAATYTDGRVAAETRYTYRIKAINQYGASERSRWVHINTPAAPDQETDPADLAPANLAAELTGGQVVLSWDAPAEDAGSVTGYEILRGEGEDDPTTLAADTGSADTTYTDATATTASVRYAYSVKAIRDGERSQASGEAVVQLPPAVPTGVLSAAAHDWVMLNWNDPQDSAITGYRILRADVAGGAPGEFAAVAEDTGSADTGYTDTTVEAETSYVYRVHAIGPGGLSGPSPDLAVNTPPAPVVVVVTPADPQAPSNLAAELADGQVVLSWDAPAQDAGTVTGYEVLRAEGQGELSTLAADTGNAGTTYTDATVASAGASYTYRVKAIRDGERSGASNEARVLLKPAIPTGLTARTVAHDSVTLAWDAPNDDEGITGYAVVRWTLGYNATGFVTISADTGTADPSYTDETAEPENEYLYHVRAINTQGESKQSEWLRVHTPAAPDGQPPAAPAQVLSGAGHDRVLLFWADPEDDSITGYRILRAGIVDGVQGEFAVLIEDTGNADTSYTDETVEPETSYVYRVLAVNPRGVSEPSSDVEVRTNAPVGPEEPPLGAPANVSEPSGDDFSDSTATSGEVDVGGSVTGEIASVTDRDWFKVVLEAGKTYQFDMEGKSHKRGIPTDPIRGTLTDTLLFLYDESGTHITYNDDRYNGDIHLSFNSRIIHTATAAGAHYLEARGSVGRMGTYTLSARELRQADRVTPPDDPDQPPVDPNQPQVTLHLSDANPFEGSPPVTVTATVSLASSVPFTVEVSATPASPDGDFGDFYGPAQEDDFSLSTNRTLSFAADATESSGTVTIKTIADSPAEPDVPELHERVTVSGVVSREGITDPDDITLTIINDDREPFDIWVSVPAAVNEDAGTATVTYTLRTRQNGPPVIGSDNIFYVLEREGTATHDDDYTRPDGKPVGSVDVFFDAVPASAFSPSPTRAVWEAERTFTIGIVDDTEEEPNETIVFRVRAGSSRYQSIKRTITILDDDTTPTVAIRAVNRDTIEGGDARFTLARTGSRQDSLIVRVTISEEDDRDLLASGVQTDQFISIMRGEAKATFTLDVRDNVQGSEDGDITAEIAQTSVSQYEIGSPSSATVTVEQATHSHPRFSHSHSHYRGGYYDQTYPRHTHETHTHGDTGNRHSETMLLLGVLPDLLEGVEAGEHVHHEEDSGYVYQGPNLRKHDGIYHVHECRSVTRACHDAEDWESGTYGGILPREVYHRHDNAEPGHGYSWPDLRANGNSPAEGHVYLGGVWRVQVGDTLTADTRSVSDPDGMSNAMLRYQWLADYEEIRGATGVSYTATDAVVGKKLRVKVTFIDDAGQDAGREEVLRSRATLKVKEAEDDDE